MKMLICDFLGGFGTYRVSFHLKEILLMIRMVLLALNHNFVIYDVVGTT